MTAGMPPRADGSGTWRRLDALRDGGEAHRQLALVLAECAGMRDVATAFLASRYAWPVARLAVVPVVRTGRALVFTPARLWVRMDGRGLLTGAAVPDAGLGSGPDTATGADVRADAVRRAVAAYGIVVDALRAAGALGSRALWGQLADTLVTTVGEHLDPATGPPAAAAVADDWLRAADPPLWVRPTCAAAPVGGAARPAWRRGSCCLAYRLPWFGLCDGCPLRSGGSTPAT